MKHLRTFLMTLGLLGLGAVGAEAQSTVKGIVIETATGERTEYALTETPKLTYDGNTVTLTTTKVSVNFTATDIVKVVLTDICATDINDVESKPEQVQLLNEEVRMSGLSASETVSIYNVSGTLLSTCQASCNGDLTITLSNLSRGVYIIKANHQSFKVTRK